MTNIETLADLDQAAAPAPEQDLRRAAVARPGRPAAIGSGNRRTALCGGLSLAQYFSRNLLVHTHIEKTGGSSFVVGVRPILGDDHVYDIRGGFPRPFEMSPAELRKIWFFSGHFWFDTQERPIARRKRYFMCIRDPIQRFISHYNYVAAAKSHPGYQKYGKLDIEGAYQFLRKNNPNALYNRTCVMFGERVANLPPRQPGRPVRGRRPVRFEAARTKIEQHYALVIPMHRIDDAIRRLGAVLGTEVTAVERVNIGAKSVTTLPPAIRHEMQRRGADEYKLLGYFESVFDRHLADLAARLTR